MSSTCASPVVHLPQENANEIYSICQIFGIKENCVETITSFTEATELKRRQLTDAWSRFSINNEKQFLNQKTYLQRMHNRIRILTMRLVPAEL